MAKWSVKSGQKYNKDRRYTKHSDRAGHSAEIRLKLPPQMAAQVGKIVASQVIPDYERASDFVVDACYHHLERIGKELDSGEIQQTLNVLVLLDDARRKKLEREAFEELIQTIDDNASVFHPTGQRAGEWGRLREYMDELLDAVDAIPPEHRSDYLSTIESQLKRAELGGIS